MNINERKILEQINKKLKIKDYKEAQFLMELLGFDKRYINFIEYMNREFKNPDTGKYQNSMYGQVDDKQVFSDYVSIYVMDEPFSLDVFIEKRFRFAKSKFLLKLLEELEFDMRCSKPVNIAKNISKYKSLDIITSSNEEFFLGKNVKTSIDILGNDVDFRCSNTKPLLMAENEKGKAYILGLNGRPRNIEMRTFYERK